MALINSTALIAEKSSASITPFRLFDLPLELRCRIYEHHLEDLCLLSPHLVYDAFLKQNPVEAGSPLLRTTMQLSTEISEFLRSTCHFTYRITCKGLEYDTWAKACFHARGARLDFGKMQHLRLKIWPPHVDRPYDMLLIWRSCQTLCNHLREVPRLQRFTVIFLENEYAEWSLHGQARESMGLQYSNGSDIRYLLDLLGTLNNVVKAEIRLPKSILGDMRLQEVK